MPSTPCNRPISRCVPPEPGGSIDLADPNGTPARGVPLPPQTEKTIGDTLSAKNVTWAWYAGAWNAALNDGRRPPDEPRKIIYTRGDGSPYFVPHHQPFNYFARFAPGTHDRSRHLKDGDDFLRDLREGPDQRGLVIRAAASTSSSHKNSDTVTQTLLVEDDAGDPRVRRSG